MKASRINSFAIAFKVSPSSNLFVFILTTLNFSFNRGKPQLSCSVSKLYSLTSPMTYFNYSSISNV